MNSSNDKGQRQDFERYAAEQGCKDFEQNEYGDYRNPHTNGPWAFWKAAQSAARSAGDLRAICEAALLSAPREFLGPCSCQDEGKCRHNDQGPLCMQEAALISTGGMPMKENNGQPDQQQGLYRKYNVERLNDPAGKHKDCHYYVLDLIHDKFAVPALLAYAQACEAEIPELAADLRNEAAETARKLDVPALLNAGAAITVPRDLIELAVHGLTHGNDEGLQQRYEWARRDAETGKALQALLSHGVAK